RRRETRTPRANGRSGWSLRPSREKLERLPVALGALADHAFRDDVRDHGHAPPLLALLDIREVHLDDRKLEQLERVANRIAVVRPRAGIDDDAVRPVARVVAPVDELSLAARLQTPNRAFELAAPPVNLRFELVQPEPSVESRLAIRERVQIDAV